MESDPTKLTSFKPLTPVASSNRFSFSKWLDGFTKRRTSQIPNLPTTSEQIRERKFSANSKQENSEDKRDVASAERVRFYHKKQRIIFFFFFFMPYYSKVVLKTIFVSDP